MTRLANISQKIQKNIINLMIYPFESDNVRAYSLMLLPIYLIPTHHIFPKEAELKQ